MNTYSIYLIKLDGTKIEAYSNKYYYNLSKATEDLLQYILEYKRPKLGLIQNINMDCNYNIAIFQIDIWENKRTYEKKIEILSKVVPKLKFNRKELDKYLELCDQPGMNVAKLCSEIYNPVVTKEYIEELQQNNLKETIKKIDKLLPTKINKDVMFIYSSFDVKDQFGNNLIDEERLAHDIKQHYGNKYYLKINFSGRLLHLYFYEKEYIEQIIEKLNKDIHNTINDYEKKYAFEKFVIVNNINNYTNKYLLDYYNIQL